MKRVYVLTVVIALVALALGSSAGAKDMQIDLSGWEASFGVCFSIFAKK